MNNIHYLINNIIMCIKFLTVYFEIVGVIKINFYTNRKYLQ